MAKPKQRHIETIRGLACLLLVAYHVIGNDQQHGMQVAADSPWRLFTELFMHVRMPLFSFVSGYVFSAMVADLPALGDAVGKKLRRIGIPFLVVSTLFYMTLDLLPGDQGAAEHIPLWQIYLLPYEHFWYLQATMVIMAALLVCGFLAGPRTRLWLTWLFPVSALLFTLAPTFDPDLFALGSAFYLLPYFLLGHLLRLWSADRHIDAHPGARVAAIGAIGGLLALLFTLDLMASTGGLQLDFARQSALGLLFGVSTCLFLFLLRPKLALLEFIGFYSYTIYLFHVFCTAGIRKALDGVAPNAPSAVVFVLALTAGIAGPIALHHALVRNRYSALLLLGIGRRSPKPASAPAAKPRLEADLAT